MKEVVVGEGLHIALSDSMAKRNIVLSIEYGEETLETTENVPHDVMEACSKLISYVKRTQKTALDHIRPFEFIQKQAKLSIDANSMRNLELVQSIRNSTKEGITLLASR